METQRQHKNTSLKSKLLSIIMFASMAGFIVFGVSLIVHEQIKLKQMQKTELQVMAGILSDATAGLVLFGDAEGVKLLLDTMHLRRDIKKVLIFDDQRTLFSAYFRENEETEGLNEIYINDKEDSNLTSHWQDILVQGKQVGYLYIAADDVLIGEIIEESIIAVLMYIFLGSFIVYFIALKMQQTISDPVSHLTETMTNIATRDDYSLRAAKESYDEIGVLTDEFNRMLDKLSANNQELVESERKFREVVEQTIDAFILMSEQGRLVDVNEATCRMLGYSRDELLDMEWGDFDEKMQNTYTFGSIINQLKSDHRLVLEAEYTRKDTNAVPVEVNIGELSIDDKSYILVSARDNTERKRAEERLQQANDQLEVKVNERTSELKNANMALSLAKEKAEAASRAKSLFLANMSHEIRTPMNSVIGFTDVLASSGLNDKQATYVESIQAGSRNLLQLINDILDISKIEAGKMKVKFDQVHIKQMMQDIKDVFSISAREKGLYLELNLEPDVPDVVMSDEVRLRQIIFNLINNAIKFTREGGVSITLRYEALPDEVFSDLVIDICDTGIGIRKEDQRKIFNVFEQQDGQSTREFGGAGLGLAISTRLAERLNSEISVTSELGSGSCFRLLMKSPEIVDARKPVKKKTSASGVVLKPARILIADDVEENRLLICEYLSKQPVEILHAENGQQAVDIVRRERPDLVLMDIRMPIMSGIEAVQAIKSDPAISDTVVVAVTASVVEDKKADKKRSLFDAVLYKPLNRNVLIQSMGGFIGYERAEDRSDENESQQNALQKEISKADQGGVEKIMEYMPILDRAKDRGSFGGLSQMLDEIDNIATDYDMHEFKQFLQRIRQSNEQFDIEETRRLLTVIISELAVLQVK